MGHVLWIPRCTLKVKILWWSRKNRDTDLRHTNLGEFLRICNKPTKRSALVSALICSRLVNVVSHPVLVQSTKLIMALSQCFVPNKRVVKSVTGEVVLDLWPDNIERVYHLPRADQFIWISYETAKIWYREHQQEAIDIIQSLYLIEKPPRGRIIGKVDMTRGYMKEDICYSIILLSDSWVYL